MASQKNLPWTPARRKADRFGKQGSVQSFSSSIRGPPSSAPGASRSPSNVPAGGRSPSSALGGSQSSMKGLLRASSSPGMSRASSSPGMSRAAARRATTPGQSTGKSASLTRLKKGLPKLQPLPQVPLTFEELYSMAKKRAVMKMAEDRHRSIMENRSTSSWSSSASRQLRRAKDAWNEMQYTYDVPTEKPAVSEEALWARAALECKENEDRAESPSASMQARQSIDSEVVHHSTISFKTEQSDDELSGGESDDDQPTPAKERSPKVDSVNFDTRASFMQAPTSGVVTLRGTKKPREDVMEYLSKIRRTICDVGNNGGSMTGVFSSKHLSTLDPTRQLVQRCNRRSSTRGSVPGSQMRMGRASTTGSVRKRSSGDEREQRKSRRFHNLLGPKEQRPPSALPSVFEGDNRLNVDSIKARKAAVSIGIGVDGFDDEEYAKMRATFRRFADHQSNDVHVDDLKDIYTHLGYLRISQEVAERFTKEVSPYSRIDFTEFVQVTERCAHYEQEQFREIFERYDTDKSGSLSTDEIIDLITSLGITPLRRVLEEAIAVVDLDGSGQLDFDEFVYLMAVYRVTEGFTRDEVELLLHVFECFSKRVGFGENARQELASEKLGQALLHMFGPQSIDLARSLAKKHKIKLSEELEVTPAQAAKRKSIWNDLNDAPDDKARRDSKSLDVMSSMMSQQGLGFSEFLVWARQLREAEVTEYRRQFDRFDQDKSGLIAVDELTEVVRALGYMPLRAVIDEVLSQVDTDNDEELDFDEFVNLMATFRSTDGFSQYEMEEFHDVFTKYDRSQSGEVSCLELIDILRYLGYVTRLEDVRRYIEQVDFNGNGSLDFREFIHLMRLHREEELIEVKKIFDEERGMGHEELHGNKVRIALKRLGYKLRDDELARVMADVEDPTNIEFELFAQLVDSARKAHAASRRRRAGFSDEEIKHFQMLFDHYDDDHNEYIERHELTNLLDDLKIEMKTSQDREVLLQKLDKARQNALDAGVAKNLVNQFGDPKVTFFTLVHFIRLMHSEEDHREVDRDQQATIDTQFKPKQVADFREIFGFWAEKSKEFFVPPQGKGKQADRESGEKSAEMLRNRHGEIGSSEVCSVLPLEGLRRLLRSLGLQLSYNDKNSLEKRMKQCDLDEHGRMDFPDFLRTMRWMLDANFANINYVVGQSSDAF